MLFLQQLTLIFILPALCDTGPDGSPTWPLVQCWATVWRRRPIIIPSSCFSLAPHALTSLPCKAKRQYLLTLQVSRYCLLALQSTSPCDLTGSTSRRNRWIISRFPHCPRGYQMIQSCCPVDRQSARWPWELLSICWGLFVGSSARFTTKDPNSRLNAHSRGSHLLACKRPSSQLHYRRSTLCHLEQMLSCQPLLTPYSCIEFVCCHNFQRKKPISLNR